MVELPGESQQVWCQFCFLFLHPVAIVKLLRPCKHTLQSSHMGWALAHALLACLGHDLLKCSQVPQSQLSLCESYVDKTILYYALKEVRI